MEWWTEWAVRPGDLAQRPGSMGLSGCGPSDGYLTFETAFFLKYR